MEAFDPVVHGIACGELIIRDRRAEQRVEIAAIKR
jgi:hypothetical protein